MAEFIDYGPIVFIRRMSRQAFEDLGYDDELLTFILLYGAVEIPTGSTVSLSLDDVPTIKAKHEAGKAEIELSFATRDPVMERDLFIVGLQSGIRLLLCWHSVHSGSVVREGESTSPRREGAPVKYTVSQALDPLETNLLY